MRRVLTVVLALVVALVLHLGTASAASTPSRPLSPKAVPGNAKVTVRWAAPAHNGGRAVDRYRVQRALSATGPWVTIASPRARARAYTSTGLRNGKRYYFRVAAHNAAGWGTPSARVSAVPRTVPTAPQAPTATAGEGSVLVAWQAPTSNGGAVVDGYLVQSRVTGTTAWGSGLAAGGGAARSLVVPGLVPGTSYDFQVRAHNAAGYGSPSGQASATPTDPGPPAIAFRFTDLDLRDPHIYVDVPVLGTRDVTDQAIAGYSVNGELQEALTTDGDGDGFLDLSPVNLFRPLDQAAATSPAEADFGARCTAAVTVTCVGGENTILTTATNQADGTCLAPSPGTTTELYTPDVVSVAAPCFSTAGTTLLVDVAGIPLPLQDARMGATYVGDPATGETNGLLVGFVSEADADATIIPTSVAIVGGQPLSSLLPGGTGNSAAHSDLDVHEAVPGWWFHLSFVATRTAWTD